MSEGDQMRSDWIKKMADAEDQMKVGDLVEVLDDGLALLRSLCPGMPPNHHGRVAEINGDEILVEFPIDGSYEEHSQVAPYHKRFVVRREQPRSPRSEP